MSEKRPWGGEDQNVTLDSDDDDWQWRRKIRSNPAAHRVYRIAVGVIGLIIVVGGLVMVPFPGPGCSAPGTRSRPGLSGSSPSPGGSRGWCYCSPRRR